MIDFKEAQPSGLDLFNMPPGILSPNETNVTQPTNTYRRHCVKSV